MKSEVRIISPSLRLTVTIGLVLVILIIFLSIWFRVEMSLILLGLGATGFLAALIGVLSRFDQYKHHRAMRGQDLRLKRALADKAEMERYILAFPHNQRI